MKYVLINDLSVLTSEVIVYDNSTITEFALMMGAELISDEDLAKLISDDRNIIIDKTSHLAN